MEHIVGQQNVQEWDRHASREGLYAVFTTRWSEKECKTVDAGQQDAMFALLPNLDDKRVLDLGCGIGRLTGPLGRRAGRVIGLDISSKMLQRARAGVTQPSVTFTQGSAEYLPFAAAQFDLIITSQMLQHILDEELFKSVLREMARILKGDGLALFFEGAGDKLECPSSRTATVIRAREQYARWMEPAFHLLIEQPFCCVDDCYTFWLWKRQK